MLHKHVLFVGDKPGKKNVDPSVAFVGTPSYKRLLSWIADMEVSIYNIRLMNSTDTLVQEEALSYAASDGKIIALGEEAAEFLTKLGVPYFKLPHPSGKNRKLNNRVELKNMLYMCKQYIYGEREG